MNLSEIKKYLAIAEAVNFVLPSGAFVPKHFQVRKWG